MYILDRMMGILFQLLGSFTIRQTETSMREARDIIQKTGAIMLLASVIIMAYGCASSDVPKISKLHSKDTGVSVFSDDYSKWFLDSLNPSEKTILFRRHTTPVSIYM